MSLKEAQQIEIIRGHVHVALSKREGFYGSRTNEDETYDNAALNVEAMAINAFKQTIELYQAEQLALSAVLDSTHEGHWEIAYIATTAANSLLKRRIFAVQQLRNLGADPTQPREYEKEGPPADIVIRHAEAMRDFPSLVIPETPNEANNSRNNSGVGYPFGSEEL